MFAAAVVLSVVGLLVGPALVSWTRGSGVTFAALDGATLGVVPGLLLLRLLPHLVAETGAWAIGAAAFGYLSFAALEARAHARATDVGIAIVLPALAIHGFLDGAGIALAFEQGDALGTSTMAIAAALVLHKVPEGLFVASALIPTLGPARTGGRILALAAATVVGALSGHELLAHTSDHALHVAVALGLGVMLRMAIHRHGAPPRSGTERAASGLAFVGSLALLFVAPEPRELLMQAQPGELTALEALAPLLFETAPWLFVVLLVGEWAERHRDEAGSAQSAMWLPMVALSIPLLGFVFTIVRALVEPLVGARLEEPGASDDKRLLRMARALARDAAPPAKQVLPSYVVGVAIAIAIEAAVPGDSLDLGLVALPLVAALALALPIGAAGVTVVAALLVHKGLPLAAALVFTAVAAHATSASRHGLSRAATLRALLASVGAVLVMVALGPLETPPLHDLAEHRHHAGEWLAGAAITVWALVQLVTAGPRGWLGQGATSSARPPPLDGGRDAW